MTHPEPVPSASNHRSPARAALETGLRLAMAVLLHGLLLAVPAEAESLRFALVAKRNDQHHCMLSGKGCAEAAQAQGDTCLFLGAPGSPHFRRQNKALEQTLARDLDGIALAVTHSKWLAEHALQGIGRVPLVTFETDLEPAERHLRKGYVGLDNLAFGRRLGELAQRLRPQGGRLCILQDNLWSTNQHERLQGIRQRLGGAAGTGVTDQLHGENGWSEPHRCPLNRAETPENAVLQLADLLSADQFDVIISLGMWPVYKVDAYRRHIGPALAELEKAGRRPVIIIATSEPDAAQHALLDEGLVQAYVDMNSREIGRQSYWMLKRLTRGESVPEQVLVDHFEVYLPRSSPEIRAAP